LVKKKAVPDFEKSLNELESLVEQMEKGEMGLEESLKAFERGILLTRSCQQALKEAEQKVRVLLEKDGKTDIEPLDDADDAIEAP
jgi:exodeoxyribonuclease VII small subunit